MRVHVRLTDDNGDTYEGAIELSKISTKATGNKKKIGKRDTSKTIARPSDAIRHLFSQRFFQDSRKQKEVMLQLKKSGYNFTRQSVFMALNGANFLTKTGSQGKYSYIQKHPPG